MNVRHDSRWLPQFRSSESFILRVVSIAIFTDLFIHAMTVPVLPLILIGRIQIPMENAQTWISVLLAVYGGAQFIGSPFFAYLEDRYRLQRLSFTVGLTLLGSAIGILAFSQSLPLLIFALGLQGLSSAATWVVGLAMIFDNVSTEHMGKAVAYTTMALTWASVVGPLVGSSMYESLGFYSMLTMPACLLLLTFGLWCTMIEIPEAPEERIIQKNEPGWATRRLNDQSQCQADSRSESSRSPHSSNEQSTLLKSLYLDTDARITIAEGKTTATVFNLLFSKDLFLPLIPTTVLSIILSSLQTMIPLFVIQSFRWSSTGVGLLFVTLYLSGLAGGYLNNIVSQTGSRVPGVAAFILAANAWILMRLVQQNSTGDIVLLVGLLTILGMAISIIETITMAEIFRAIEYHEKGSGDDMNSVVPRAYALFHIAFAGGQLLGPILAGLLDLYAGWATMTTTLGLICGLMVPIVLRFDEKRPNTEGHVEEILT